jgi:methylase of polypeptide subunit release factors
MLGVLSPLARAAYPHVVRSRSAARLLFGIDFGPISRDDYYFDVTTWVLARCVRARVAAGMRVLDMGTGAVAALAQVAARHTRGPVTAAELDPALAASARASVRHTGADVRVVHADLFAGVEGPFDWVLFNPPYVPTGTGERRGLSQLRRSQWDGGGDGTRVLARFLGAFARQPPGTRALVGLNRGHLPRPRAEALVAGAGALLAAVHASRVLPVDVYELYVGGGTAGRGVADG